MPYLDVVDPAFRFTSPEVFAAQEESWWADSPVGPLVLRHAEAYELLRDRRLDHGGDGYLRRNGITAGHLGTHAITLSRHFRDTKPLLANIRTMLGRGWFTQNYVGEYFMGMLPRLATTPEQRQNLLEGLAEAIRNDAKVVTRNIKLLPRDWVTGAYRKAGKKAPPK